MKVNIEYAIVALSISAAEFAAIVKDATGLTIDPNVSKPLELLDKPQLEAVWKRLSEHDDWRDVQMSVDKAE